MVEHRLVFCPDCHLHLGGISLARLREVTYHRIYKGWCAGCQKWHEAAVQVQEAVLGQGRIDVRLASMIAYLRTVMRLLIRQIQHMLFTLHGFPVSAGKIVELLHRTRKHAQTLLLDLKGQIRASRVAQADNTFCIHDSY